MKLAIYFQNKWYTFSIVSWGFLTNHARVLLCIARDPGVRLRDIASSLGIAERSAHGLVADLTAAGYVLKQKDGRRNRYQIQAHMPLLETARNLRSAKSSLSSPAREPSVTGQPRASDRDARVVRRPELRAP
jgi:MarR family